MANAAKTRIFRLYYDPETSERIEHLVSLRRFAYNVTVNIPNRMPTIGSRWSPRHPDGLLGQIIRWGTSASGSVAQGRFNSYIEPRCSTTTYVR